MLVIVRTIFLIFFQVSFFQICIQRSEAWKCGDEPKPNQHKYRKNFKLNNCAISGFPETSHIFKPLLNAVLYFQNLKNQRNVYPQSLVFGFQMSRKLDLSCKVWFQFLISQRIFSKRIFSTKFGFSFPLLLKIFRLQFSLIILRKNRSEAFCVSSENILHLTFHGLFSGGKFSTKPSQIYTNY